jgi:hypothetical protein
LFVPQTHEMRKCDFSDHAFSVFLFGHCLAPHRLIALQGAPEATLKTPLLLIARGECTPD